jgi:hypothetical protein
VSEKENKGKLMYGNCVAIDGIIRNQMSNRMQHPKVKNDESQLHMVNMGE